MLKTDQAKPAPRRSPRSGQNIIQALSTCRIARATGESSTSKILMGELDIIYYYLQYRIMINYYYFHYF